MYKLYDLQVCAASNKVHTTRNKARAIFTEGDSQIVFIDTPGLVHFKEVNKYVPDINKQQVPNFLLMFRYNLEKSFIRDTRSTLLEADIIGVIHDVSNTYTRESLDTKVINLLEHKQKKPSFLVLNKVNNKATIPAPDI